MSEQLIADAAERACALDPRGSFIVQAPAGSGKTELLTQRLLVLLATVDEPEEVLAITFTRKAAAEMRSRVFAAVRAAADDTPISSVHQQQTRALAQAVLARSQSRNWRIEDNPQRLRVMTIDALCMQIAQQMPLTAGFGGRVRIADEPEALYREAARATLAALESDGDYRSALATVLRHFDNRLGLVEQQLVSLLKRRDQWLHFATASGRAARAELEAALAQVIGGELQKADALLDDALRQAWLASAAYASSQRYASDPQLSLHRLRDGQWPSTSEEDSVSRWQALIDLVLTGEQQWRKTADARLGFPAGKSAAEKRECQPPRDAHLQLIAELQAIPGLRESLQRLRALPAARYDEAQWQVLQALLDVLRLAAAQLSLQFAARGEVDFVEVAARAVTALGSDEAPTELALSFDYRIAHLLVDEFQDTSRTQYALLRRLTAGWQAGDGRSLFVVGDPMQSIYRFRQADVGLYLRARSEGLAGLPLQPLKLHCNFRSTAGVIDWINARFPAVLAVAEDSERGAVPYSAATATRAAGVEPAVQLHTLPDGTARGEARRVLAIIADCRARDPDGSIAVLVRSRTHLDELVPALRAAGLRYQALDLESLASRPVIEDLRALTRALLHPLDRVAWLALLRAPWCGLRLAELLALSEDLPADAALLTALRDPQRLARLDASAQQRLARTLGVLEDSLVQAGRKPLRRWVESAWLALGGPAILRESRDLLDAQQFFARLEQLAPGAQLDELGDLDAALQNLRAAADPGADGTLSLMTIHKAKGLEFDTVIVPGLARTTRSDSRPPIIYSSRVDADDQLQLLLAPVQARGQEAEPTYEHLRAREADKQLAEDARLLYVAATRARQQLHLLATLETDPQGQFKAPPPSSLLARLWPAVAADCAVAAVTTDDPAPIEPAPPEALAPPLRRLLADWQAPALPAGLAPPLQSAPAGSAPAFDWAGETARITGTVFHRWVQAIAAQGLAVWDQQRLQALAPHLLDEMAAAGVPETRRADAAALVGKALHHLLDDPRGRWLFDPQHREAHSEWALSSLCDGQLRRQVIDRSFVDAEGRRWVIDFKTSRHEGGDLARFLGEERERYRQQLESYVALLRSYGPEPVRAALYLPLIDDVAARWQPLQL